MCSFELRPEQKLAALARQPHSRGFAYVISDQLTRQHVVLCARLPKAHQFLASVCEHDPPCLASLYEGASSRLRNGLHHRRWRVQRVPLRDAPQEFERERLAGYQHPIVLAQHAAHLKLVPTA